MPSFFQAVRSGSKVLCCAPSNVAVDNLLEKLSSSSSPTASKPKKSGKGTSASSSLRLVRLGHPARMYQHLLKYSLDAQIGDSDQTKIVSP